MTKAKDEIGLGDLAEDVLGLNIRGLITIRDTIVRPGRVAEAARTTDWNGVYTPSIRVAFFLLTLLSVLRFLWAPDDGPLTEFLVSQIAQSDGGNDLTPEDIKTRVTNYFAIYAAAFPFTHMIGQGLAALITPVWGQQTSLAGRLRLHFAALVPGLTVGIATTSGFGMLTSADAIFAAQAVSMLIALVIDGTSSFRMLPQEGVAARLWRATVFAIVASVLGTATALATSIAASLIAF